MARSDRDSCPWCTHGTLTVAGRELNTIETRPDPDGGEITRCADCYAEYVANRTLLTQLEAHVLTLANDGHSEERIGQIVGRSLRNVHLTLEAALEKRDLAEERRRTAEMTLDTIDRLETDQISSRTGVVADSDHPDSGRE